jgi:hypothetical protein
MTDVKDATENIKLLHEALKDKSGPAEYGAPELVAINHDKYDAEHVGRTADGRQFFLTTPFEPAWGDRAGSEFLALFLFDAAGNLLEAKIDDLGPRATMHLDRRRTLQDERLKELGKINFERIEVKPFFVERFGRAFGLIPHQYEESVDKDRNWYVLLLPGNYMSFVQPWNRGRYDT